MRISSEWQISLLSISSLIVKLTVQKATTQKTVNVLIRMCNIQKYSNVFPLRMRRGVFGGAVPNADILLTFFQDDLGKQCENLPGAQR